MAGTIRVVCLRQREGDSCLNGVRPRWPEQCAASGEVGSARHRVSMESGLDGRNNLYEVAERGECTSASQWSPA